MVETDLRKTWSDWKLDGLNREVARKFIWADRNTRELRADIIRLTDELNEGFLELERGLAAPEWSGWKGNPEPELPDPNPEMTTGEPWDDARIEDLRLAVSDGTTYFDRDIRALRDRLEGLRSEMTSRFACLGRWRGRGRRPRHRPDQLQRPVDRNTEVVIATLSSGRPWTDGRIDDLNHRVGAYFERLDRDIKELKAEARELRRAMNDRLRAKSSARFRLQTRIFLATMVISAAAYFLTMALTHGRAS